MSGYVYLLKCQDFYKIGIATDVHKRISGMQTGSPYTILLVASVEVDNPLALEKELHAMYSHRHHRREWFALTEEDVNAIRSLFGAERVIAAQDNKAEELSADNRPSPLQAFALFTSVLVVVAVMMLFVGMSVLDVFPFISTMGFVFFAFCVLAVKAGLIKPTS